MLRDRQGRSLVAVDRGPDESRFQSGDAGESRPNLTAHVGGSPLRSQVDAAVVERGTGRGREFDRGEAEIHQYMSDQQDVGRGELGRLPVGDYRPEATTVLPVPALPDERPALGLPRLLVVALVTIFVDLWWGGPLKAIDIVLSGWAVDSSTTLLHLALRALDTIGRRALTTPFLLVWVLWLRWRTGRWRPLALAAVAVVAVNVTVGTMKVAVGRGSPSAAAPELFVGGVMWPSGHAANVAVTATMLIYLLRRYGHQHINWAAGAVAVAAPSAVMATVSVSLGFHWLSDLLAGSIVGYLVAIAVIRLDGGDEGQLEYCD